MGSIHQQLLFDRSGGAGPAAAAVVTTRLSIASLPYCPLRTADCLLLQAMQIRHADAADDAADDADEALVGAADEEVL